MTHRNVFHFEMFEKKFGIYLRKEENGTKQNKYVYLLRCKRDINVSNLLIYYGSFD